jgi:hypothetical protein
LYRLWAETRGINGQEINLKEEVNLWIGGNYNLLSFIKSNFKNSRGGNFEFADFSVNKESTNAGVMLDDHNLRSQTSNNFITIIPNNNTLRVENLSLKSGIVLYDPSSFSQKVLFAGGGGLGPDDLLDKQLDLKKGKYLARILYKTPVDVKENVAEIIISSLTNLDTLGKIAIGGHRYKDAKSYQEAIVEFEVKEPEEIINLKIKFLGVRKLWIDTIEIFSVTQEVEAETLSSASGSRIVGDENASGKKAIYEDLGASFVGGYIFYGDPKLKIKDGDYITTFRMKVQDNKLKRPILRIDNATKTFNYDSRDIWGSEFEENHKYQFFSILMNKYISVTPTELRCIWYPKTTPLWVDKIDIATSIEKFQAEDLSQEGIVIYDTEAEGERAIFVQPNHEKQGVVFTKQLNNFTSRKFLVTLKMKSNVTVSNQKIASFNIYEEGSTHPIAEKGISVMDFDTDNQYRDIRFEVNRDSDTPIKLELLLLVPSEIWIDYIDIFPLD